MSAVVQTTNQSFAFNGESDLDLEYAMALTNPQTVTLFQVGDAVQGNTSCYAKPAFILTLSFIGGSFGNWLDAVDGSFCTFKGGDDPSFVRF